MSVGRDGMGINRIDGEASLEGSRLTDEGGIKFEMKDAVVSEVRCLWNSRSERVVLAR